MLSSMDLSLLPSLLPFDKMVVSRHKCLYLLQWQIPSSVTSVRVVSLISWLPSECRQYRDSCHFCNNCESTCQGRTCTFQKLCVSSWPKASKQKEGAKICSFPAFQNSWFSADIHGKEEISTSRFSYVTSLRTEEQKGGSCQSLGIKLFF